MTTKTCLQDLHCHLDLYPDFEDQIKKREQLGIRTLTVTTTPRAWPKNKKLTEGLNYVRPALGFHPELISKISGEVDLWDHYIHQADYVGEVGLDGRRDNKKTLGFQSEIFEHILKSTCKLEKKVITVHSSSATTQTINLLEKHLNYSKTKVILHWYTGSATEAQRAIQNGYFFSINPQMLKTKKWQSICIHIPPNRMLIETDSPFCLPQYINNEKDLIVKTVTELANQTSIPLTEFCNQLNTNFMSLF